MCVNKEAGRWCQTGSTNMDTKKFSDFTSKSRYILTMCIILLNLSLVQAQDVVTPSPTPRRRRPVFTFAPTPAGLTASPTLRPTLAASSPSLFPTVKSTRPLRSPAPSRRTSQPTRRGTTPSPTRKKTLAPTVATSAPSFATEMPTPPPTMMPTFPRPSAYPTTTPRPTTEYAPSAAPSQRPTMPLGDMTRIAYKQAKAKMALRGISILLDGQVAGEWVGVTAARITQFIESRLQFGHYAYLHVTVRMVSQQVMYAPQVNEEGGNVFTRQQPSLDIHFNVDMSMLSLKESHDMAAYLTGAFNTEEGQATYKNQLAEANSAWFHNVISAAIEVLWVPERVEHFLPPTAAPTVEQSGIEEAPQDPVDTSNSDTRSKILFAISVISACAGIGILFLIYFRIKDARERKQEPTVQIMCDYESTEEESRGYASEIDLAFGSGDVSTLGAPSLANISIFSLKPAVKVSKVSIKEGSLAWEVQQRQVETDELQGKVRYRAFLVEAPPGVLGLVLETKSSGIPTVQIVRESSVLHKHVKTGDQLLSVDGEDVTEMNKAQVSELMCEKQTNRCREMLFRRQKKKRHKKQVLI